MEILNSNQNERAESSDRGERAERLPVNSDVAQTTASTKMLFDTFEFDRQPGKPISQSNDVISAGDALVPQIQHIPKATISDDHIDFSPVDPDILKNSMRTNFTGLAAVLPPLTYMETKRPEIAEAVTSFDDKWLGLAGEIIKEADKDGDGEVDQKDLATLVGNATISGPRAQILAQLYKSFEKIDAQDLSLKPGTLSQKELEAYIAGRASAQPGSSTITALPDWMGHIRDKAQKPGYVLVLYADKDPLQSITPDAIRQGTVGTCAFLATLASLAASRPEAIRDMLKDNKDGTYTVTFPGAADKPVTVKAPTETELGLYNHAGPYGTWASVMEKAYGAYLRKHKGIEALTDSEAGDGGAFADDMVALLTNKKSDKLYFDESSREVVKQEIHQAIEMNKLVIGTINRFASTETFPKKHAYAITAFDPNGPDGGKVTVRNPWNAEKKTERGTIDISLDRFMREFSDVTLER